jgi:hypothetical protein
MTDHKIALRVLLEKSSDASMLREEIDERVHAFLDRSIEGGLALCLAGRHVCEGPP